MLIIVDSNEEATNPGVVAKLRKHFKGLQVSALSFGDMNVLYPDGSILAIERKNAGDFLGSISDGRLFRQVENMANNAKFFCIIVVGNIGFDKNDMVTVDGRETNWRGSSVRGAMYAVQWSGCPLIFAADEESYPYVVGEISGFCAQPEQHFQKLNRHRVVTFPPIDLSVEIVSSFPGVGIKRAQALIDFMEGKKYNSLAGALAWASAFPLLKEGQRPEGWGNKTVANFRGMLGLGDTQFLEIKEMDNGSESGG